MATKNRWMSDILGKVTQKVKEYTDSDFHTFIVVNGERIPFSIDNISFSKMDTNNPEMELHIGSKEGKEECSMGNAAAMRRGLEKAESLLHKIHYLNRTPELDAEITECIDEICIGIKQPPRNCDVGTAEEQIRRIRSHCKQHRVGLRCVDCSVKGVFPKDCALIWAQMPYEANEKGEVDDSNG